MGFEIPDLGFENPDPGFETFDSGFENTDLEILTGESEMVMADLSGPPNE
ncbi:MAG: hypothetical protein LBC46_03625 [Treponema sp.]|jgi:hypothetical protein|nr:hypothetical protein [Treponema sp.]